ncbi:MAG: hypothetical protein ACI8PZ_003525 [Myxococcota bacterium]
MVPVLFLIACPKATPVPAASGVAACPVEVGDDLPDAFERTAPEDDPCAPEKYWDTQPGATTFFVGDYTVDTCGAVSGEEAWVIHPNATFQAVGGKDCVVWWDVDGRFEGPLVEGTHTLSLRLTVDTERSDCPPNGGGRFIWDGEEMVVATYSIELTKDGEANFSFSETGTPLGAGRFNASHVTFTSPSSCKYF